MLQQFGAENQTCVCPLGRLSKLGCMNKKANEDLEHDSMSVCFYKDKNISCVLTKSIQVVPVRGERREVRAGITQQRIKHTYDGKRRKTRTKITMTVPVKILAIFFVTEVYDRISLSSCLRDPAASESITHLSTAQKDCGACRAAPKVPSSVVPWVPAQSGFAQKFW